MNNRYLSIILYLLFSSIAFPFTLDAKEIKIEGEVIDEKKESLIGVSISNGNFKSYTISDENGNFSIMVALKDTIVFSYIGYEKKHIIITEDLVEKYIIVELKPNAAFLNEVIVSAPEPMSSNFSTIKLDQMAIYLNPVADGDALKAITLLPSSTTIDESASPSLRGSDANRSVVLINGVPIQNPVKYSEVNGTGSFSLFSTEIIKDEMVYASNPPIIYGKASGGAIGIETVDEIKTNNFQLSTQLAGTSIFFNQKISNRIFIQLLGNLQYSDLYTKLNSNVPLIDNFKTEDIGANIVMNMKSHKVKTYIYAIDEGYTGTDNSYNFEGKTDYGNRRLFIVNNYKKLLKNGVISIDNLIDLNKQTYKFGIINYESKYTQYYGNINYRHSLNKNFSIISGVNFDYTDNSLKGDVPLKYYSLRENASIYNMDTNNSLKNLEYYLYSKWDINNKFSLSGGIRYNFIKRENKNNISTQISSKYNLTNDQSLLLGIGKYYNYSLFDPFSADYYLLKSSQFTLDYIFTKKDNYFSAALYHKREDGTENILNDLYSTTNTKNNIFGLELFYETYFSNYFKLSLGYTYIYNKFIIDDKEYKKSNHLPYLLKISLNYNNYKVLNIALTYITRGGTYYTPIVDTKFDDKEDVYYPIRGSYNSDRYANYNNLSLNINKIFFVKKHTITPFFSLNNLLNIKNQKQKVYENDYTKSKFFYYSPISVYFGVMLKFGY
ncbi:hypothetical protein M2451_003818 [Dysgonomonas sp. PFB1-18]|uniref:TonB-dependent receptor n=1 Tax=unclassified Dysgonomonas TaxID=2630389 RepID=UPI0024734CD3|nr:MULTISPECIES: carboxypeptidase-like regulatory domain-containing protein [unclassified Dysgonomonas]MDH6310954.1 hypothetical protein [Dysgonomonas sp. PF1-14]MDH6340831.1 hypothetical protein [Dysgonomonas sp. PF1-16]MDH6382477.1 hypothetical protein [Dysgonomonas sp. PFB1-18]MDH6399826.1 hypothetical protein [Dysgonomonas sp. PF1-23]